MRLGCEAVAADLNLNSRGVTAKSSSAIALHDWDMTTGVRRMNRRLYLS